MTTALNSTTSAELNDGIKSASKRVDYLSSNSYDSSALGRMPLASARPPFRSHHLTPRSLRWHSLLEVYKSLVHTKPLDQ
jgi:hypothetical protein